MVRSRLALALLLGSASLVSMAQDAASVRALAATCASCHGTNGRSATSEVASLAGLPKEHVAAAMRAFRDGSRPATVMHQLAKGYTDREIELLAAFFAAQERRAP